MDRIPQLHYDYLKAVQSMHTVWRVEWELDVVLMAD